MNSMFERATALILAILVVASDVDASVVAGRSVMSWMRGSDEPVRADETTVTGYKPILQLHKYNGVHIQPLLEPQPAAALPPSLSAPVSEHIVAVPDQQMINMLFEAAPYLPEMEHLHEVEFAPWQPYIQAISEESFDRIHETVEVEGEARVGLPSKAKILKFLQLLKEKKLKPIRDAYQMKKNLINSALNLLHPIPPPPPPPPSPPVAPTFYYAPSDAIVVEAAAPSVYDLPPPPPPPPSPVFVPHPSLHSVPLPPPTMPYMMHHPVPQFPTVAHVMLEHPRFHELADIPFPPPPPTVPMHHEEIHAHAHESPSMDVILGHDLHAAASENEEHVSPSSSNATATVVRREVVEESHIDAVPTQSSTPETSTMPVVIAPEESHPHERQSRSLDQHKTDLPDPYCVGCIISPKLPKRPRSVSAATPFEFEPTLNPPPAFLEASGELTQSDDRYRPTRQAQVKPCGCIGPCKHDHKARSLIDNSEFQDIRRPPPALEPINIREAREVDVARPVVSSPAPQNVSTPSPAVEALVQSTEANDTSRPKRQAPVKPCGCIGPCKHDHKARSLVDNSEFQDIRRPPPALEPITIREPREVNVAEPVVESSTPKDVRTSSPAVEDLVQSTEANDTSRPKRQAPVKPCGCIGPCKHDHRARSLADSSEFQDIRRPPPALEREPREVGSSEFQDIRRPPPALDREPREVGSSEFQDIRRPPPALDREPREVGSSEFQDIRRPPPALDREPREVGSSEFQDIRRPPPALDREPREVISSEFQDIRRPPPALEREPREVGSSEFQDIRRPPPALDREPREVGSSEFQDIRRPPPALEPITIRESRLIDIPVPVTRSPKRFDIPVPVTYPPKRFDIPVPVTYPPKRFDIPVPVTYPPKRFDIPVPMTRSPKRFDIPVPVTYPPKRFDIPVPVTYPPKRFDIPVPVTRSPKRLVEDCVGCRRRNLTTTKHPFGERKPREVDILEPVVESSTPQDIHTPSPAVEPVVQSTEPNDSRKPKRQVQVVDFRRPSGPLDESWAPRAILEPIEAVSRLAESLVDNLRNLPVIRRLRRDVEDRIEDIRRPPPALEPITIREPREVDVLQPVVENSTSLDVRTPSSTVEPVVQSTESNVESRPKRHADGRRYLINQYPPVIVYTPPPIEPFGVRQSRQVDILEPVVESSTPQDIHTPSSTVEPVVQSTESNVESRPKRHVEDRNDTEKSPTNRIPRELYFLGNDIVDDSSELQNGRGLPLGSQDLRELPEFVVERRSKRHADGRSYLINQYPIIISTPPPIEPFVIRQSRQVNVTEPSVKSTKPQDIGTSSPSLEALVKSAEVADDKRRPTRRIHEYTQIQTDDEAPERVDVYPAPAPSHPAYPMLPRGKPTHQFDIYLAPGGDGKRGDHESYEFKEHIIIRRPPGGSPGSPRPPKPVRPQMYYHDPKNCIGCRQRTTTARPFVYDTIEV